MTLRLVYLYTFNRCKLPREQLTDRRTGPCQDAFGVLPGLDVSLLENSEAVGFEVS